jgi:hypothetical protein
LERSDNPELRLANAFGVIIKSSSDAVPLNKMGEQATAKVTNAAAISPPAAEMTLQRKCDCGNHTIAGGQCDSCKTANDGRLDQSIVNEKPLNEVPPQVREVLRSSGEPLDKSIRAVFEPRLGHDFSRVRVHTDDKAAASAKSIRALAYTMGDHIAFARGKFAPGSNRGQQLLSHELTHVVHQAEAGVSLQRFPDGDNEPATALPQTPSDLTGTPPPAEPLKNDPPPTKCVRKSLAATVNASDKRMGGQKVEPSLDADEFGNTSKFGADFKFGACKMDGNWRFHLEDLVIPIASKIQPIDFRKNITAASDSEVTKTTYPDIVSDLSPTNTVTFSVSCGKNKDKDKVTTYSVRKTYWNQEFVIKHEAKHVTDWVDFYRKELAKSESEVQAHSIPESEATTAAGAVAKANKELTEFMANAYGRLCAAFNPKKESRAYDDGAPLYQKLVDEIKKRATAEKW